MTKRVLNKNYLIRVLDMYDYGSSYDHSDFYTYEEALYVAKQIILSSFSKQGQAGYDEWMMFGEDAYVVAINGAPEVPQFKSQEFVKRTCGLLE
jgi:hypothetical protein